MVKIEEIILKKSVPLIDELQKLLWAGFQESGFENGYRILSSGITDILRILKDNGFKIKVKQVKKHETK